MLALWVGQGEGRSVACHTDKCEILLLLSLLSPHLPYAFCDLSNWAKCAPSCSFSSAHSGDHILGLFIVHQLDVCGPRRTPRARWWWDHQKGQVRVPKCPCGKLLLYVWSDCDMNGAQTLIRVHCWDFGLFVMVGRLTNTRWLQNLIFQWPRYLPCSLPQLLHL